MPRKVCRFPLLIATAILGSLLLCAQPAFAQQKRKAAPPPPPSSTDITEKKEDLQELRKRIESLRKELSSSEESHAEASDQLRQSEQQISEAERKLFGLRKDQSRLQDLLQELAQQSSEQEATLSRQQMQLEKLLYRQYLQGSPDTLQLLLNGDNPNQIIRNLYYFSAIARARADLLADISQTLKKQQLLAEDTRSRALELSEIESRQKVEHEALLQQKTERKKVLNQISDKMKAQKQEIGNLERNEKRLANLIDRLTKLLAEQAKKVPPPPSGTADLGAENRYLPDALKGDFSSLKGRLRLPVRGQVLGRFGQPREGKTTWKGLYIRADEGSEVKSIASGQIVYAEWMRGFGNLIIIDHGRGYLTVYGNNHSLLKQVGDRVLGGETISTVGSSGGEQNSGLYFELRHQGQAIDPMKWVSLK